MSERIAIVTGAAGGIGRAIVRALADSGVRVVASDVDASVEDLFTAATAIGVTADLTEEGAPEMLVQTALDRFGGCDVVVNNAATGGPDRRMESLLPSDIAATFEVNLLGPLALCRAALPLLRRSGAGRIVNVGSVFATRPAPADGAYSMSKSALEALTRSLALEEAGQGVTANTVAPGYIMTGMHRAQVARDFGGDIAAAEDELARLAAGVPLRRHGAPEDVAGIVAWLATAESAYITGQTIWVDGGLSLT